MKPLSFVYVAIDNDNIPIATSDDINELLLAVDYHHGAHEKFKNESTRVSWQPFYSKYPSEYEGKLTYDCPTYIDDAREIVEVRIYTVDHFNKKKNDTGTTTAEVSKDF